MLLLKPQHIADRVKRPAEEGISLPFAATVLGFYLLSLQTIRNWELPTLKLEFFLHRNFSSCEASCHL